MGCSGAKVSSGSGFTAPTSGSSTAEKATKSSESALPEDPVSSSTNTPRSQQAWNADKSTNSQERKNSKDQYYIANSHGERRRSKDGETNRKGVPVSANASGGALAGSGSSPETVPEKPKSPAQSELGYPPSAKKGKQAKPERPVEISGSKIEDTATRAMKRMKSGGMTTDDIATDEDEERSKAKATFGRRRSLDNLRAAEKSSDPHIARVVNEGRRKNKASPSASPPPADAHDAPRLKSESTVLGRRRSASNLLVATSSTNGNNDDLNGLVPSHDNQYRRKSDGEIGRRMSDGDVGKKATMKNAVRNKDLDWLK